MFGEILTTSEVECCETILARLSSVHWAAPLLKQVGGKDTWSYDRKPLLFELRFAGSLHAGGWTADYEYAAGLGESTIDFAVPGERPVWLIELVAILTSDAVKEVSWENGLLFGAEMSTDAKDPRHSPEGETILVQQKIGEKVLSHTGPIKFPEPAPWRLHMILVDVRAVGVTGADIHDCIHVAYGARALAGGAAPLQQYWRRPDGTRTPILGLFDPANTHLKAAELIRERIHFLAFCSDEEYGDESFASCVWCMANPHLLPSAEHARMACRAFPVPIPDDHVFWFAA